MTYSPIQKAEWLLGRYVSLRPHSEQEVRRYLQRKAEKIKLLPEDIDTLVEKYTHLGFIDDQKFAESMTHNLVHNKKKGSQILKMKLKMAGVDPSLISQAVGSVSKEEIHEAMDRRMQRYSQKIQKLEKREAFAKAYQVLFSSGFSSSEIRPFLDEWMKKEYHKAT